MSAPKRWPKQAAAARERTAVLSEEIVTLAKNGQRYQREIEINLKRNPEIAEKALNNLQIVIAYIEVHATEIQLWMERVRHGLE